VVSFCVSTQFKMDGENAKGWLDHKAFQALKISKIWTFVSGDKSK
jgi:hypothetical protein